MTLSGRPLPHFAVMHNEAFALLGRDPDRYLSVSLCLKPWADSQNPCYERKAF
jgi:hypothetical protein